MTSARAKSDAILSATTRTLIRGLFSNVPRLERVFEQWLANPMTGSDGQHLSALGSITQIITAIVAEPFDLRFRLRETDPAVRLVWFGRHPQLVFPCELCTSDEHKCVFTLAGLSKLSFATCSVARTELQEFRFNADIERGVDRVQLVRILCAVCLRIAASKNRFRTCQTWLRIALQRASREVDLPTSRVLHAIADEEVRRQPIPPPPASVHSFEIAQARRRSEYVRKIKVRWYKRPKAQ